jgi:restriction endonuclease
MDKQPIRNAAADAESAIRELDKAIKLEYCATFKGHINNAAYLLEQAAKYLRDMERGG